MSTQEPHSAQLLGTTRNFWWNDDFIELMARRWHLDAVGSVLDVGSGIGHWGRTLLPHLDGEVIIKGVDPEPKWVEQAIGWAERDGLSSRLQFSIGSAERLPFVNDLFDLVTCQTVLVHVANVQHSLKEMIRVLKPGGLLAVAEPNNLALSLLLGSTRFHEDPAITLELVQLQLICERGKEALGEGNNSIGDLIPGYFNECGLRQIMVYQSDHATPLIPPYNDLSQQANRDELLQLARENIYIWNRTDAKRYFLAGGGVASSFEGLWTSAQKVSEAIATGLLNHTEHQAGGSIFYLISARKPD